MDSGKPKKNIFLLGIVSLFTDLSSQMIYPLIPEFLVSIGTKKAIIGIIEGIAESTASLFRPIFGRLSDKLKKRKLFIFLGYGLSAFSKPFLFFANSWATVLAVRFSDRVGKASRTPARDALISTSVDPTKKGRAFGFHRAMDRIGAIGGPILALLVLYFFDNNVRIVFLLSIIPAIIALFFIKFVKETSFSEKSDSCSKHKKSLRNAPFVVFLVSNIIFNLGNSSNAFLILKAREVGLAVFLIPVIWIVYNIFCTLSSPLFGTLSDRIGRRPIIITSFIYYSAIYFLFAFSSSLWSVWVLFGAYGIYYGLSEGVFRAYVSDLVSPNQRATAYGLFNTGIGLALFPASIIMGTIWDSYGSRWAFIISALFSLLGFLIFLASLAFKKIKVNQNTKR
ncbi:MAG: MFS transporter [Actinobacteria bacterium]|nr:MFS transporter [Actinomycetota bacterium]